MPLLAAACACYYFELSRLWVNQAQCDWSWLGRISIFLNAQWKFLLFRWLYCKFYSLDSSKWDQNCTGLSLEWLSRLWISLDLFVCFYDRKSCCFLINPTVPAAVEKMMKTRTPTLWSVSVLWRNPMQRGIVRFKTRRKEISEEA